MGSMKQVNLFLILAFLGAVVECYQVPPARVEILAPKGLRVSIPDEEGISLFAFHGQINEEFETGREAGHTGLSQDVLIPRNGRWTFTNRDVTLRRGDRLYYWLYVIKDGIGHERLLQTYTVLGFSKPLPD